MVLKQNCIYSPEKLFVTVACLGKLSIGEIERHPEAKRNGFLLGGYTLEELRFTRCVSDSSMPFICRKIHWALTAGDKTIKMGDELPVYLPSCFPPVNEELLDEFDYVKLF